MLGKSLSAPFPWLSHFCPHTALRLIPGSRAGRTLGSSQEPRSGLECSRAARQGMGSLRSSGIPQSVWDCPRKPPEAALRGSAAAPSAPLSAPRLQGLCPARPIPLPPHGTRTDGVPLSLQLPRPSEALAQPPGSRGCSGTPGSAQGQAGRGLERPGIAEGVPAPGRILEIPSDPNGPGSLRFHPVIPGSLWRGAPS